MAGPNWWCTIRTSYSYGCAPGSLLYWKRRKTAFRLICWTGSQHSCESGTARVQRQGSAHCHCPPSLQTLKPCYKLRILLTIHGEYVSSIHAALEHRRNRVQGHGTLHPTGSFKKPSKSLPLCTRMRCVHETGPYLGVRMFLAKTEVWIFYNIQFLQRCNLKCSAHRSLQQYQPNIMMQQHQSPWISSSRAAVPYCTPNNSD